MVEQYQKFIKKLSPDKERKFKIAIIAIQKDDFSLFDVKQLKTKENLYRLRI